MNWFWVICFIIAGLGYAADQLGITIESGILLGAAFLIGTIIVGLYREDREKVRGKGWVKKDDQ